MVDKSLTDFFAQLATEAINHTLTNIVPTISSTRELVLLDTNQRLLDSHPNPLNKCGRKIFSQNEEDGITYEIIRRLNLAKGVFAEFGVGDGIENNTISLAAIGWKGFWAGGQDLSFPLYEKKPEDKTFAFHKCWLTRENIFSIYQEGLASISESNVDVLSLDLDGNDYYLLEELLKNEVRPKLFIVEYNSKFPPPIRWKIDYNPRHTWENDDYFGASISSFGDLFEKHGYFLACCNVFTGTNAFFIRNDYQDLFSDIPKDINTLWSPPRYFLMQHYGHPAAAKSIEIIFRGEDTSLPIETPASSSLFNHDQTNTQDHLMKYASSSPRVTEQSTDFGGMNIIYHAKDGPIMINRHDVYVGGSLKNYGEFSQFEWLMLDELVPKGSIICEVGANYGTHTTSLAKLVGPEGAIYAFEPQRIVFQALCGNIALHGLTNVWCYNVAVGNESGHITVPPVDYSMPANIGGVSLTGDGPGEKVALMRLDDVLEVPELQLIKIDVEGMELEVLKGATKLIEKHRPGLYIENDRVEKSEALIRYLQSLNYRLYWHKPPLYNPDNYFNNPNNIFPNIVSINMVGIPDETELEIEGLSKVIDPTEHPLKK